MTSGILAGENLDCVDADTLRRFREATDHESLRRYIDHKLRAIESREIGCISLAMRHERKCDRIYEELPDELKW